MVDLSAGIVRHIFDGDIWHASWSPDSRQLALSAEAGLFTARVDGTVSPLDTIDGRGGMFWSPSGDSIASASRYEIVVTDAVTGASTVISPAVDVGDYLGISGWVPNGDLLMCSSPAGDGTASRVSPGTYVLGVADGSTRKLLDTCGIRLSPDGASFLYSDGGRILMAATDGSEAPRLLVEGYEPGSWSLDGRTLTLDRNSCETGDWDIYSVEVATGAVTRLTNSPDVSKESAGWSANGELAYSAVLSPESYSLVLLDSNLESRTLLTSAQHIHGPGWSPDGRYLSFVVGFGHGRCGS